MNLADQTQRSARRLSRSRRERRAFDKRADRALARVEGTPFAANTKTDIVLVQEDLGAPQVIAGQTVNAFLDAVGLTAWIDLLEEQRKPGIMPVLVFTGTFATVRGVRTHALSRGGCA